MLGAVGSVSALISSLLEMGTASHCMSAPNYYLVILILVASTNEDFNCKAMIADN